MDANKQNMIVLENISYSKKIADKTVEIVSIPRIVIKLDVDAKLAENLASFLKMAELSMAKENV